VAFDPYVYPGTTVLKNKFGLRDPEKLAERESVLVWKRFSQIYGLGFENIALSEKLHKTIHKKLFEEVYPFAGKFREIDISKPGETPYASSLYLNENSAKTWIDINRRFATPPADFESLYVPLATSMGELHVLHPFREGNTRTLQLVAREIAWRAGYDVQWMNVDPELIRPAGTAAALEDFRPYIQILRSITKKRENENQPRFGTITPRGPSGGR
jgi:cell filamentation protein